MVPASRKRIVLIDDHALLREGLERLLSAGDEFVICEEAGTVEEGMELVRELRPDAVILDIEFPGQIDGIEVARRLWGEFPDIAVIILSGHEQPEYWQRAAEAGAMAYVLKSEAAETLRTALRDAFRGRRTFPETARKTADEPR